MPKSRWTRTGAKSGPCNTFDGRFHLARGWGRVEVVDLTTHRPVPGVPSFPTIKVAREWIDANTVTLLERALAASVTAAKAAAS